MRTFPKIFGSSSRRETPRIHKFDAVVVYGHTGSSGSRPPGTMDQQVKGCFPDGLDGDGKCVDALDLTDFSANIQINRTTFSAKFQNIALNSVRFYYIWTIQI